MNDAIEALITRVIEREGGYVNHPNDRGGPTKYGITQATLARHRGTAVTEFQVSSMSEAEAREIYRAEYFRGLERVNDPALLEFLFDYAVNSGPGRAVKCLMTVLGGRKLAEINDQAALLWPALCERFDFFMRILSDASQAVFANGWANRMLPFWRGETPAIADPHPGLTPAEADGILVRGEKGEAIRRLQEKLGILADGDFGPATEAAVIAAQAYHGLTQDGVVGPKTRAALGI